MVEEGIPCSKCGEPYEYYYIRHEMINNKENAYTKFMKGEGCPSCEWGSSKEANGEDFHKKHQEKLIHETDIDAVEFLH